MELDSVKQLTVQLIPASAKAASASLIRVLVEVQ